MASSLNKYTFLMLTILSDDNVRAQIILCDAIPLLVNMLENTDDSTAAIHALRRLLLNGVLFFGVPHLC